MWSTSKMWSTYCLLSFFFIAGVVNAVVVPFKDCGSHLLKVVSLDLDCEGGKPLPCELRRGETYQGKITLNPTAEVFNGTISLYALIHGVKVQFSYKNSDLCSNHNVRCPMKPGETQVMEMRLSVPSYAPSIRFVVIVEITTSSNVEALCFQFLAGVEISDQRFHRED